MGKLEPRRKKTPHFQLGEPSGTFISKSREDRRSSKTIGTTERWGQNASRVLDIPVIVTEQYPRGLGPTVPELGAEDLRKFEKTCFSMLTPEVEKELRALPQIQSVILCGIETQACIMSTALDLLEKGLDVHVVADACSSRSQVDRLMALSRLKQSGAFLTTSEGTLLQLVTDAKHPKFREVQKIIMDPAPDSNLMALFQGQNPLFT
ncbi:isochorismatase domain-containing protein 2 isoform X2 [Mustelus asterias]